MEENKKEGIFKKIENNVILQIVFFVVSMTVIVGAYVVTSKYVRSNVQKQVAEENRLAEENKVRSAEIVEDYKVYVNLSDVFEEDDKAVVTGEIKYLGATTVKAYLTLREASKTEESVIEVEFVPQINQGGKKEKFIAYIDKNVIEENTSYEIMLYLVYCTQQENSTEVKEYSKKVSTEKYLYNGALYFDNPVLVELPEFSDNGMKEVVKDGMLYDYSKEYKLWVYEYKGIMYWIADSDFQFDESGLTYIPFQIHTHDIEKLPTEMQEERFANLDFKFEEHELRLPGESSYRVAYQKLPVNYMITWVRTGVYNPLEKTWRYLTSIPVMRQIEVEE